MTGLPLVFKIVAVLPADTIEQSVPFFLIDDIEQRLTRGKAPAVVEEDRMNFAACRR
jgi:hypothetical protein